MKRLLNILICIIKARKIFSVKKNKFVIFDCNNSDVLRKILPENETYVISARIKEINTILINYEMIIFIFKNFFSRSVQLNYYANLIKQLNPQLVITQIDNSLNFSILTKYFENKIKFVALQNATRGDIIKNEKGYNKYFYFTDYMGLSDFDYEVLK